MADQPDFSSIPASFATLKQNFLPEKAAGVNKVAQFNFTGSEPGTWAVHVHDGTFEYNEGPAENPNVTVTTSSQDWLALLRRELNPVTAVMSGRLKIQGDMGLMMQFQQWFRQE